MDYTQIITIEPGKRSGQPCIRGMRITVRDVLEYLAGGMNVAELLAEFPELTAEESGLPRLRRRPNAEAGRVSLLFDQNLSRRLPALLAAEFPGPSRCYWPGWPSRRPGGVVLRGGPRDGGGLEGRRFPELVGEAGPAPEGDVAAGGQRADPRCRGVVAVEGGGYPGVPVRSCGGVLELP